MSPTLLYDAVRKHCLTFLVSLSLCSHVQAQNAIVTENALAGNPSSEWDITGAGDLSIQGFATDISVNKGGIIRFKIDDDDESVFSIKIYRLGYYHENGARLIADLGSFNGTDQPEPISDLATGLIDCGNWSESASWPVPQTAVSGLYIAKLTKTTGGSSHIMFIVRDDQSTSDLYFQTSDATWQAYNVYGGNSLYVGSTSFPAGHAAKVSYNRPFITRNGGGGGGVAQDGPFNAEYPMIRWLEKNGYDISYTTNIDAARNGNLILNHKVFLSVGHDEYWSAEQRAHVEGARNAGVNLAFFSGNEVYWKTRWENSVDGSNTPYRTLVCYKEGTLGENQCNTKCDPLQNTWTGLWRDGCSYPAADGCKPENALTGQISWGQNEVGITVPDTYKNLRFWRNTSIPSLTTGQTATLPEGTVGYEYSFEQPLYASKNPAGRILLSSTEVDGHTHKLSLYRHSSGALVFGAGTVQWSWGLDGNHDRGNNPPSTDMQQATVNLLADMTAQPATLEPGLVPATISNDNTAPSSVIVSPANNNALDNTLVTITGTASDANTVAGVEVSVDGGTTWTPANGTNNWTFSWTPASAGNFVIKSRAFDDNGNMELAGTAPSTNAIEVTVAMKVCPCTIFQPSSIPAVESANDGQAIELGVKFKPNVDGFITGIRFYKATGDNGTHVGHLWSSTGNSLSFATFSGESASGWQQVSFGSPVAVTANTTYVASYFSSANFYSYSQNFFTSPVVNGPLTALANDDDGPNGVYIYTAAPAFPINTFGSSNYWVDVVFESNAGPDVIPPTISSTSPASNATDIKVNTTVKVTFNEAIDPATINNVTFELLNGATPVNALVSYNSSSGTATLAPSSALSYSTVYAVTVKGGSTDPRVKDIAGNALSANSAWTFTTASPPGPDPTEGPGGPILIISSSANPFSRYPVEILRAEGLNEFSAMDISSVNASVLNNYDVVILGEISLSSANVTMLTNWVNTGKTLITFKPDAQLSALLGITPAGGSLADKYVLVNTAAGPGAGIVGQTIQFHGTADQYTLNGATSLATLYSDATTATVYPAVTIKNVGTNGGKAVAFTYDLARSIVYTRQGNPALAGQKRDGQSGPIRSDDMFFPDYVDFNKIAIPQADEQQHLLSNIILQSNLHNKPLPKFWFLPRKLKAAIVMTGDDHGNNGTTERFNHYSVLSGSHNTAQDVADWTAIRGTSYIYPSTPMTNAQAVAFEAQGFEISLHLNTNCAVYTPTSLESDFTSQLAQLATQFPGIPSPTTHRTHCISWSDWATKPKVEFSFGIRLNTDYYYWPAAWIQDRPGLFTGSGMPMRYADLDGTIIDNYQVVTQMTDESEISYANFANQILDKAIGPEGYYGVFCANMHTDENGGNSSNGSDAIIAAAQSRQIPVISARQMLTWLDGRNGSSFGSMIWNGNALNFTISVAAGAHQLQAMVPVSSDIGQLTGIFFNSVSVNYTTEVIKGINYAFFDANNGNYSASYAADNTAPVISSATAVPNANGTATVTWTTDEASDSKVDYGSTSAGLNLDDNDNTLVTTHSITLNGLSAGATYYFRVTSKDAAGNSSSFPIPPATLSFTMLNTCANDQVAADFTAGTTGANTLIASDGDGAVTLRPSLSEEFAGTSIPAEWTEGLFNPGGTTVGNGSVTVNGTHIFSNNSFAPGSSIEFSATYNSASFQNIGFSADQPFNNAPWVTIGQGSGPDGNLYARASDGSSINLGSNLLGSFHRFFIKWNAANFEFYIDGSSTPAATINFAVNQDMYLQISDVLSNDGTLSVDWLTATPYQASGSYTSRVFDHGGITNWNVLTWSENKPAGTGLAMFARGGNTAIPDGTWSNFTALSNGGSVGSNSRYVQYRADLSTTDSKYTPVLKDVSINCGDGADNVPPVISNIDVTPSPDGLSATVTWITNENANSGIDYGTDAGSLLQHSSSQQFQTSHSLQLTALTPGTTYYFRITSADEATNSSTLPDPPASQSFITNIPSCFDDASFADFSTGTGNSTYIIPDNNGQVILKPALAEEFAGNVLPEGWQAGNWHSAGSTTVSNGSLLVNGSRAATISTFAPGASLEFVATFSTDPFQNIGFAADLDFNSPWFAIGNGSSADGVYARADGQSDISLGAGLLGIPHRYRIDWNTNSLSYFVDGVLKATINVSISNNLVAIISDFESSENASAINVDWLRVQPYAPSGSFVSRVYDASTSKNWGSASWTADVPAGTGLQLFQREGNTAVPDQTWTSYAPIVTSGDNVGGTSRYIQYRADLATTNNFVTPVLKTFGITCSASTNTYYQDADGDSFGNPLVTQQAAVQPTGYVTNSTDCDDTKSTVHPGATELCNGIDDNCDGQVDEGFAPVTYYRDNDGDGYGDAAQTITAKCAIPAGYVTNSTDCDDSKPAVHPGAPEVCDGIDNNCDGTVDEGCTTCIPPTATITAPSSVCKGEPFTLTLAQATGQAPFDLVINGVTYNDVNVGQPITTFNPAEKSIWGSTGTPDNASATDGGQAIETGTKFRSTVSGYITGIRFYKGTQNTGAHIARLWSTNGIKLAEATFVNETGSGWQEVRFEGPVAVTANTTYIASYFSPAGGFAISTNYFASASVTNGTLTALQSGTDGPNGVYKYGGGFPDGGNTANYWVDVLFNDASSPSSFTYTLTNINDQNNCGNTGASLSTATVSFNPLPEGNLAEGDINCQGDISLKFNASAGNGPFNLVINNITYNNITSGTLFSTGIKTAPESTIWPSSAVGGEPTAVDNAALELGVKFSTAVGGTVTGIRFYKRTANTGIHTGSLWSSTGSLLAAATFSNETASGWQQVTFATPVSIAPNTTYIASYYAPAGQYAYTPNFFSASGVTNGPLTALKSGTDGGNGVYKEGAGFPNQSFNDANYWVDVVFKPGAPVFNLTRITDAGNCANSGNLSSIIFSLQAPPQIIYYHDADNDGFGNLSDTIHACVAPAGYVTDNTDCNDNDNAKHASFSFFVDADSDGFGTGNQVSVCATDANTPPAGYALNNTDCDDNDTTKHTSFSFYLDADGDGFGSGSPVSVCAVNASTPPAGYSINNTDNCPFIANPDQLDSDHDGVGNVCDNLNDDDGDGTDNGSDCAPNDPTMHASFSFYLDADGDGFGSGTPVSVCAINASTPPAGYSINNTDNCPFIANPDQLDSDHDGVGNVCDNLNDDDGDGTDNGSDCAPDDPTMHASFNFYLDADGDGFGAGSPVSVCAINASTPPAGYSINNTDNCPFIANPDQLDSDHDGVGNVCDNLNDDDGDGTDNGSDCAPNDPTMHASFNFYLDADGDGFGAGSPVSVCAVNASTPPAGYSTTNTDCDDQNAAVHLPEAPGSIAGPKGACKGQTGFVYSVSTITGATSYAWTLPAGATGSSTSNSIIVNFTGTYAGGDICVQGIGTCGTSSNSCTTLAVYSSTPATPGAISGPANTCPYINTSATYSIVPVAGAATYRWKVPVNSTLISASPDSTSVNVQYSGLFSSGNITVQSITSCGSSLIRTFAVKKTVPSTPLSIAGPADICNYIGLDVTYSIAPVAGAVSYLWAIPPGVSYVSGQGSANLVLNFPNTFTTGNVTVQSVADCGTSSARSLTITRRVPATPGGVISGPTDACPLMISAANPTGTQATYTIRKVLYATSYTWGIPAGSSIVGHPGGAGINDTIIIVIYNGNFTGGAITVTANSNCGSSSTRSLTILRRVAYTPGTISGPTDACPFMMSAAVPGGTEATYTIRKVVYATSYTWSTPAGVTINTHPGGSGTINDTSITVTYNSGFVGGSISVTANSNCGSSSIRSLSIYRKIPSVPGVISGPADACPLMISPVNPGGTRATYTIRKVLYATSYTWGIPAGVTLEAHPGGPGTINDTSIIVTFNSNFVGGAITVAANSNCINTRSASLSVSRKAPATPGAISGPADACPLMISPANPTGTQATYTIRKVLYATSYTWNVPAGVTIEAHPGGPGTVNDTSITVTYGSSFVSGTLTVIANANCGSSGIRSLSVSRKVPSVPGVITGPADACPLMGTTNTATYSIATMPLYATSLFWIVPGGARIEGGQGTLSITVSFDNTFVNGTISVQGINNCAVSTFRSLSVTKKIPSTPGVITSTKIADCPSRIYSYAIASVANASSYLWVVPSNATITNGQSTNSITVSYNALASGTKDSVKVNALNNCAQSAWGKIRINLIACSSPGTLTSSNGNTKKNWNAEEVTQMDAEVMPNPSLNEFKLVVHSTNLKLAVHLIISDVSGKIIENQRKVIPDQTIILGIKYRPGIYFAEFVQGEKRKVLKLVKL